MTKLSREDWLEIGLQQLGSEGPAGLRITPLCQRAGVTRGSFYHHFADQKAFAAALLSHWEKAHTLQLIELVERADADAVGRRHLLSALTAGLDMRVEAEIRRWAASDASAQAVLERVDARRLDFLTEINRQENSLDEPAARDLAGIEYAVFLAYPVLFPSSEETDYRRVGRMLDRMIASLAPR